MESQPQNPEIRNNPETFHPCSQHKVSDHYWFATKRLFKWRFAGRLIVASFYMWTGFVFSF